VNWWTQRKTGFKKDKRVSGFVTVDNLMIMMKAAENNIMLLNQVRERALEELQQVHSERDKLQSQVQVLQRRPTFLRKKLESLRGN
jgi:chromosome segregation ATPase